MKICMIVGVFPPGKCGIGDYTERLCNSLSAIGVDVNVITSQKYSDYNKNSNINLYPIIESWNYKSIKVIYKSLNEIKPDIVHIQYPSDEYGKSFFINYLPALIKRRFNIKIVETVHEYIYYTYKGKLRNLINYLYSDLIICVEERYEDLIKSFIPLLSNKLNIITIPISSNIPQCNLSKNELDCIRKQLLSYDGELLLSYFGFINKEKGFDNLLKALYKLKKSGRKVKLLVVGELRFDTNNYHKYIKSFISELELQDDIIWTGFIENPMQVANYLASSQICVLPFINGVSKRNGSFLAAVNQNIAVITTGTDFFGFDKKTNVFYMKDSNPDSIFRAINEYQTGEWSDNKVNNFILSWDDIAIKTFNAYKKILL